MDGDESLDLRLQCSLCIALEFDTALAATIINGHAVCLKHMSSAAAGESFFGAVDEARKRQTYTERVKQYVFGKAESISDDEVQQASDQRN